MALRFRDVARPKVHFGSEKVRSGELKAVFGVIEQDDRSTDLAKSGAGLPLHVRKPRQRPVDRYLPVRVVGGAGVDVFENGACALELAEVGERVAQVGRD